MNVRATATALASLDWQRLQLSGRVLIEASAGTGKTWNIGVLFLRLLLERELRVEQILVTTFTDAAAQELRERLRGRLADAERLLANAAALDDDAADGSLEQYLARRWRDAQPSLQALRRVRIAQADFDRAPITTFHALCQRIQRDWPLDSGAAFAGAPIVDEEALLRECIEDFWRQRFLGDAPAAVDPAVLDAGPDGLVWDLRELFGRDARVFAAADPASRGAVLADALAFCRRELPRRAQRRNVQTFALMIDTVHERLCGDGADAALADRLFEAFPAALVDEFQDIDGRQYAILDRIYRERGTLVMIGDPKQAIYGFRGGDIAAYLRASAQTPQRWSLGHNQRSSAALLGALNALYARAGDGFGDPRIRYHEVRAAGRADATAYTAGGHAIERPLAIHRFAPPSARRPAVAELEARALDDCANRIAELIADPQQRIGERRVAPGDIAVLVPNNAQVTALRRRLAARGVPCVGGGRGSVFDSDAARELELILHALVDAGDDGVARAALTTRLLGADHARLRDWQQKPAAFEQQIERLDGWRDLVRRRGVLALVNELVGLGAGALLAGADGERWLTDLRHLGELLAEEQGRHQGLEGLVAWFGAVRRDPGNDVRRFEAEATDQRRLRLESDARCAQVLTVHGSKGLEFPIVFLPLAWRIVDRQRPRDPKVLHFHDDTDAPCVDLGSAQFDVHRARHFREDWQERLRLLYVALTRAQYAVHVYWHDRTVRLQPDDKLWDVAALDTLLFAAQRNTGLAEGEAGLDALVGALDGTRLVPAWQGEVPHYTAEAVDAAPRSALPAPPARLLPWLHSFSGLTRQVPTAVDERGAADEGEPAVPAAAGAEAEAEDAQLRALAAWHGPRFGNAVHGIFELAPATPEQRAAVVADQLAVHGIRERGGEDPRAPVAALIERVHGADLGDGLRLGGLAATARVAEFEFQFPLERLAVARLRQIAAAHAPDLLPERLSTSLLHGMLTGFVDLIFAHGGRYHVLDYKTNWLGTRRSDYHSAALDAAMREHAYGLQAVLYTVALHRYLRQRLPGYDPQRQLGDSWYLFVRAVGLEPDLGVWRRRWPLALILELDAAFAGAKAAA